jgi:mTERF domain-containing protein
MFRHVVAVLARNSKEVVTAKLEFFKRTLGCSESELFTAVSKKPSILGFFDKILLCKIEFLVNEAAMEPRYIVERPVLLTYSLEKRLVPRHYVMKVLQEKGLLCTNMNLFTFTQFGEETFKLRFIDCHKDSVPGLADAYATARASIVPSTVYFLHLLLCFRRMVELFMLIASLEDVHCAALLNFVFCNRITGDL